MIKFFRKIRYDLMEKNKTGKYLKYAIGEIVLVVVGILIALSINNWNQDRLNKKQIYGYLTSLAEDLKSDIIQYDSNIGGFESQLVNNSRILISDDYKKLEVDSIFILVSGYWNLNKTSDQTYEKIKNAGLQEMLGTHEINKAVNDYYNLSVSQYEYLIEWDKNESIKDGIFWNYNDSFEANNVPQSVESSKLPFQDNSAKRKEDLIKLTESLLGRNYLRGALGRDELGIRMVKGVKSKANNLLELIEKEIDNK